jgi:hypothetical protein
VGWFGLKLKEQREKDERAEKKDLRPLRFKTKERF